MKKIYKLLLVFVLSFVFINEINAADPYFTAIYTNKLSKDSEHLGQPDVMIALYSQRIVNDTTIYASPMNDFTYNNKTYTTNTTWISEDVFGLDSEEIKVIENNKISDFNFKDNNYFGKKFLYYNNKKDKLYLSNDEHIKQDYNMLFEKTIPYQKSNPNSVLQEMMCTYGDGGGQPTSISNIYYISIRMVRENDIIKYQVYKNFQPFFNEYQVISGDYKGYDAYIEINDNAYKSKTYLKDHFSPRIFWDEKTGSYECPDSIVVGYEGEASNLGIYTSGTNLIEIGWEEVIDKEYKDTSASTVYDANYSYKYEFGLFEESSYIEVKKDSSNEQSKVCVFSENPCNPLTDENCHDKWDLTLKEDYYNNNTSEYTPQFKNNAIENSFNKIHVDVKSGIINENCNELPVVYTNCLNGNRDYPRYRYKGLLPSGIGESIVLDYNVCLISSEEFPGAQKLQSNEFKNSQDISTIQQSMGKYNGLFYKQLSCELKPQLYSLSDETTLRKTTALDIYTAKSEFDKSYNIMDLPCSDWGLESDFTCTDDQCKNNLEYTVNKQIRETLYYCQDVYKERLSNGNESLMHGRYKECQKFEEFYNSLVDNGVISDLFVGCDILSNEFKDKLNFYLDIIKIAGPILAIILGMMDFLKVVVVEDADKEMKTAWKNFKIRLISAALLFLVPVLLSMVINIFIGDDIRNNPFCGLLETEEKYE